MFASDSGSERASSIEDYQNTCAEFVKDISRDYADWVDRYNLGEQETAKRKGAITSVVSMTVDWIFRYADTIRKVDVVMNDGVNKMAENTAGYPFALEIVVNGATRYVSSAAGQVSLNVRASPRPGRMVRLGNYQKGQLILINSSGQVDYSVSSQTLSPSDLLDDCVVLDARGCARGDLLSITLVAEELENGNVMESRGYSTLLRLT